MQNELRYLRLRTKRHEIMVAFGKFCFEHCDLVDEIVIVTMTDVQFLVIVIQRWTPAGEKAI
jgi:type III secretory pathway component EscV